MTIKASFQRYKAFYGEVAYAFLNQRKYLDWERIPTPQDMVRITITYENMSHRLNKLYREWCKNVKLNYSNE